MEKLTDKSLMPFGKYRGMTLSNVPDDYLLWLYLNDKASGPLLTYLEENIDSIKFNAKK